jgi:neopullulanase
MTAPLFEISRFSSGYSMRFWPSYILAGLMVCAVALQAQAPKIDDPAQAKIDEPTSRPVIEKIDPPDWWTQFPSPMLLIHGQGLGDARFIVTGKGVALTRTQISANGHWAFLWLDTQSASPQTLTIVAKNGKGEAHAAFRLAARRHEASGHAGVSSDDVMYLIMTDRFAQGDSSVDPPGDDRRAPRGWHGGNFGGIEQHLDYLKQLGVTAIWTTPVVDNEPMPESYHGYAATDLYAIDPHFGTLAEYRHLSDALHARGIKLIIDLAPNHIGVDHPWVNDPPAPDWLHGTLAQHRHTISDFNRLIDPHAPPQSWLDVTSGWFTDAMPDLNQENPLVEKYLIQNALWWVETANLDGIRLDTFPYVSRNFWHDFDATLHAADPRVTTVGEIFNRDPRVVSFFAGGATRCGAEGCIDTGLYTPFDFPVHFALIDVLAHGKPMTELADALRGDSLYPHPEHLVPFIGNHDTQRFLTEAGGSVAMLKLAQGLAITLRGTPLVYSGDEIGMDGGDDPDNRHDFPGGFTGDARDGFTRAGRTVQQQEVFSWTSGMIALRKAHPALESGLEQNVFADNDVFAFVRTTAGEKGCTAGEKSDGTHERFLVVVNKASSSKPIDLPLADTALAGCTRFTAESPTAGSAPQLSNGILHIDEAVESMTVYEVQ